MSNKITKQWADTPFPLIETPRQRLGIKDLATEHGAIRNATEMCLIHNSLIRILNCIYLQAPNVKSQQDIADFTTFMKAWTIFIHEHHTNEEEYFFPHLEEYIGIKGYMSPNIEQHHAFEPHLEKFVNHIQELKDGKQVYDGAEIRSLIDAFGGILTEHLKDEVTMMEELQSFGDKINWVEWQAAVTKRAVETADKMMELPILITNMDATFERPIHGNTWPVMPWFVRMVFRWVVIPRNKGAWRFSSCDAYSMPKDLEFV